MGDYRGRDAIRAFNESSGGSSFSGMRLAINDLITAGTKVIVRFTNSGAQTGPFMGVRASGKHAEWMGIGSIVRFTPSSFHVLTTGAQSRQRGRLLPLLTPNAG
jgi:predicted ester cyclase